MDSGADSAAQAALARSRVLPALAVAYQRRRPFVTAWVREGSDRPVRVLVAAGDYLSGPRRPDGSVEIAFPLGAVGRPLGQGEGRSALTSFSDWAICEARFDPLAADEGPQAGRMLDDYFTMLGSRPMAWLVVARPLPRSEVTGGLDELSSMVGAMHSPEEGRGAERLKNERAQAELRYLEQWSAFGFWELEVLAGGLSAQEAATGAALLSSASDLAALPVRLRPHTPKLSEAADTEAPWSTILATTAEVVAALVRPPIREMPGVRVVAPPAFDITPESSGSVRLGPIPIS